MPPEKQKTPPAPPALADQVPLRVESAWGAVAAFCMWQSFGIVLSNAFVFLWTQEESTRDPFGFNIGALLSGLALIVIFLSAESALVGEMRRFFSDRGLRAFAVLSSPLELFKLALTLLSAAAWLVCFTAYPFPAPAAGPHRLLSLTFLVGAFLLALANNRANKKGDIKLTVSRADSVAELVVQLVFGYGVCAALIAWVHSLTPGPEGFYMVSPLVMGVALTFTTHMLVRGTLLTRDLPRPVRR